ncbi:MAG TPA: extracellular solute-binding protein [Thermomicrobiales bacterium]|nr:extracellular solute-binding protein [Thermomicrobiales bacterium]
MIQDSGAQLPAGPVTVRWVDSGDAKEPFNKKFFAAYHAKHANITIQYDPLAQAEINKVVPLGIQNSNAPDLFSIPQVIQPPQAISEGWVAPLDDLIPNFKSWKAAFPPGAFANGITDFNGKTYTVPFTSNQRYSTLTLFNVAYLQQAGIDPVATPLTWDEYRAAAKKLTQQGAGKYYGVVLEAAQTPRLAVVVSSLAQMAGAAGNGGNDPTSNINFKTGEFNYTTDQYVAAIELLLALKADGSVFPGSTSLNAAQARAQFPNGIAGLILQGPWNIPGWQTDNPDFKFGVGSQPVPNNGKITPIYYGPGGGNQIWVYAKSQNKAVAGDLIYNMGLPINEAARAAIGGAADPPIMPQAEQGGQSDPLGATASQLYQEQMRLGPDPGVRNPDVAQVYLELKNLKPDFGQVIQGLFTGQLKDTKAAMQDLQDRAGKELDRAIKAAQAKGAKVSRDDWKFANWDPAKDYTEADYQQSR